MKQPIGPMLPGTKQVLLTFGDNFQERSLYGRDVRTFTEMPQLPFLPLGLFIWGATNETLVHAVKCGNMTEVELGGSSPIPGRYFEQGRSFEDIERLAAAGELELAVEARQQLMMSEVSHGMHVTVALSGPFERFCLWGRTYAEGIRNRRAVVERIESGAYAGRLDHVGLAGIRTVLDVTAPDARVAADLLIGLQDFTGRH